jgi:hypothetical protein
VTTPSDTLFKYWLMDLGDEEPRLQAVHYMTPQEITERDALNVANTATALRARVIAELARENGGRSKPST